jgi:hypothetical protein
MNDPRRWKDGAGAPPAIRELLGASRRTRPMTSAERRRTAGRVANLVSVPVAASLVWVWAKGVAIAGVATLSAVSLVHVSTSREHAPSLFASAPEATVRAGISAGVHQRARAAIMPSGDAASGDDAAVESTVASPSPPPPLPERAAARDTAPAASTAPAAATVPAVATPAPDTLEKEANLLESARAVLAGDPARALALLDRHAAEFPRGQLVAERSVLRIDALRRLGRLDEAQSDGRALDGEARIYAPRVQKMIDPPR